MKVLGGALLCGMAACGTSGCVEARNDRQKSSEQLIATTDPEPEAAAYRATELPPVATQCINPVARYDNSEILEWLSRPPEFCEWALSFDELVLGEILSVQPVLDRFVSRAVNGQVEFGETCPIASEASLVQWYVEPVAVEVRLRVQAALLGELTEGSTIEVFGRFNSFTLWNEATETYGTSLQVRQSDHSTVPLSESARFAIGTTLGVGLIRHDAEGYLAILGRGALFSAEGAGVLRAQATQCHETPTELDGLSLTDAKERIASCSAEKDSIVAGAIERAHRTENRTPDDVPNASLCEQNPLLGAPCESDEDCRGYSCSKVSASCVAEPEGDPLPATVGPGTQQPEQSEQPVPASDAGTRADAGAR